MKKTEKKEIATTEQTVIEVFTSEQKANYKKLLNGVNSEIKKAEKCYFQIAFKLHQIYNQNLFAIEGYKNIYEFAEDKFNYARGTCNNYINIVERFGEFDESGICIGLKSQYKDFGKSQLQVMVSVDEMLLPNFTPDMTIRHMKDLAKSLAETPNLLAGNNSDNMDSPDNESMNPPKEADNDKDDYSQDEDGFYTAKLAEIPDIYNINEDICTVINEQVAYFKEKHPNTKFRFAITLTW